MGGCASKDKNDKVVVSADAGEANAGGAAGDEPAADMDATKDSSATSPNSRTEANGDATRLNADGGCVLVLGSRDSRHQGQPTRFIIYYYHLLLLLLLVVVLLEEEEANLSTEILRLKD